MTRSFGWSALIHLSLLIVFLLLLLGQRPHQAPPTEASTVVVRPMKVAEPPERPELVAGDSSQASETAPVPEPALAEPETEPEQPQPALAEEPSLSIPAGPSSTSTKKASAPQFLIEEPNYPTHQKAPAQSAPGDDPIHLKGNEKSKDRPALPYYHPSIPLEGRSAKEWILVRFEVEANGTFQVEILEGTGNIHQDARVLNVLRRWKWLPMKINGETYRSVEVVRLYRRDV
ncbi:MAG: hypothetical protein KC800_12920 [Candidatus Eremiobacteraeota bacterium]|nr:hypothetical protein [Candidatus Eremiobacteraeota bacterium]